MNSTKSLINAKTIVTITLAAVCILCSISQSAEIDRNALIESYQQLQQMAQKLQTANQLDSYAQMRLRLVDTFLDYLERDLQTHPDTLAAYAARDLERIINQETARLQAIASGQAQPIDSPRRVYDQYPQIAGQHLEQPVQWADGTIENRPIFLFGFGHSHFMRNDIDLLADLGVNYSQSEFYMRAIMPEPDRWDNGSIEQLRKYIARAGQQGVLTDILIAPHYMPSWVFEQHPSWRITLGGFLNYPINQPEVRQIIGTFVERAVSELAPDKNFWSCCLINEPAFFFWTADPDTRRMWRNWLISRYGNIDQLNEKWQTEYQSWFEVPVYNNPNEDNYKDPPGSFDWMRFNDERIANFIEWIGERVYAVAPDKLTHAKLCDHSYRPYDVMQGIDPELIPRRTDLAGTDSGNVNTYSILTTVSQKPLINSEHHFFGDGSTDDKPQGYTRSTLWLQALAGLDGSAAWIWGRENRSPFVGQWCFRPGQTEEYLRTGLDLMRVMPDIVTLRQATTPVVLLYSRTSVLRDTDHSAIMQKTAKILRENGINCCIATEQMASSGQIQKAVPTSKAIILPGTVNLPNDTLGGISWLVKHERRRCITIGQDVATLNAYNHPAKPIDFDQINIPDHDSDDFAATLVKTLAEQGVTASFRLVDPATMQPVQGVEYRTAVKNERTIATAVNTSDETVNCVWVNRQNNKLTFTDTLELRPAPPTKQFSLAPNQVILGTIQD